MCECRNIRELRAEAGAARLKDFREAGDLAEECSAGGGCLSGQLAPQPAIERSRRTQQRCPDRSRPDRPTRGSQTNTGCAGRASHRHDESQSSY